MKATASCRWCGSQQPHDRRVCRGRERMKRLNADPEFAKANSERMKRLHADPEFNPLAALTPEERADYDVLRKKGGYSREEALAMVRS